ncbi:MAG: hypothetical protein LHV69_08180 [Elusimicrobia bacterium]|nr:hypothetical protein [Candidatus Obscuribacterium magneticum]
MKGVPLRTGTILLTLLCFAEALQATERLFYKELNFLGGYSHVDKWTGMSGPLKNSAGFEDYRKFSNDYGDYLTTDLQVRLAYDDKEPMKDAWALEIHNAWLESRGAGGRKYLVGHFDPAFGLEPTVDTHATLFQTLAEQDIGFNKDWGGAVKGIAPAFDYQMALQLGSGMSLRRQDGSYLATARAGSPAGGNLQYGLSLLLGRVLETEGMGTFPRNELLSQEAVVMNRGGADAQVLFGPFLLKGEAAYGTNGGTHVLGYLGELDITIPRFQDWELEVQYKSWINDLDKGGTDDSMAGVGASYKLNKDFTLRAAYLRDVHRWMGEKDEKLLLQAYYFGR